MKEMNKKNIIKNRKKLDEILTKNARIDISVENAENEMIESRNKTHFCSVFQKNKNPLTPHKHRTPSMAAAAYGQIEDFCANNIVYGTKQLCKSVGETGCVVV